MQRILPVGELFKSVFGQLGFVQAAVERPARFGGAVFCGRNGDDLQMVGKIFRMAKGGSLPEDFFCKIIPADVSGFAAFFCKRTVPL